jgi:ribonuclease BN (tRNA processing enzyme)
LTSHARAEPIDANAGTDAKDPAVGVTRVVLLGTGTPNAEPDRSGPSVAIVVNGATYLVDAGPGVVRRASAAASRGISALEFERLTRVFLTHLHSDHTLGLSDLMLTPWVLGRTEPLAVFGPRGTKHMVSKLLQAYGEDIGIRTRGLERANETGHLAIVHEIRAGEVYRDANVTVSAFLMHHGAWRQAFGYRFATPDRTIVISGDGTYSPELIANCNGCDVLIHEVYSQRGFETRPEQWQRYHADSHTSTVQLAHVAIHARPRLLVLYHQLFWGRPEEEVLAEIQGSYSGKVVSGHDLDTF